MCQYVEFVGGLRAVVEGDYYWYGCLVVLVRLVELWVVGVMYECSCDACM